MAWLPSRRQKWIGVKKMKMCFDLQNLLTKRPKAAVSTHTSIHLVFIGKCEAGDRVTNRGG